MGSDPSDTSPQALHAGVELFDERPDGIIGQGSRGPVVLGKQDDAVLAVKMLGVDCQLADEGACSPPTLSPGEQQQHEHVVRTLWRAHDACGRIIEGRELAAGGEFFDMFLEEGPMPLTSVERYFRQIVAGVAHCHASGLANGQFRMEHVLCDLNGNVKLIGFRHELKPPIDQGPCMATPSFAQHMQLKVLRQHASLDAPEWRGAREHALYDELVAADTWGLGVLLSTMIEGQPPFMCSDVNLCPRYAQFVASGGKSLPARLSPLLDGKVLGHELIEEKSCTALNLARLMSKSDGCAYTWQSLCGKRKHDFARFDGLMALVVAMLHPNPDLRPPAKEVLQRMDALSFGGAPESPAAFHGVGCVTDCGPRHGDDHRSPESMSQHTTRSVTTSCSDTRLKLPMKSGEDQASDRLMLPHSGPVSLYEQQLYYSSTDDAQVLSAIEKTLLQLRVPYGKMSRHAFVLELSGTTSARDPPFSMELNQADADLLLMLELASEESLPAANIAPVEATSASGLGVVPSPSPYHLLARMVCGDANSYHSFTSTFMEELRGQLGHGPYPELAINSSPPPFSIRLMKSMMTASSDPTQYSPPPKGRIEPPCCKRPCNGSLQPTQRIASPSR